MDATITDRFDLGNLTETEAWQQVATTLQKPFIQRTEDEVSLFVTLLSGLDFIKENQLSMQVRTTLCKSASMITLDPGTVLLEKTEEHNAAFKFRQNPEKFRPSAAVTVESKSAATSPSSKIGAGVTLLSTAVGGGGGGSGVRSAVSFPTPSPKNNSRQSTVGTSSTLHSNVGASSPLLQSSASTTISEMQELQQRHDRVIQSIPFCLLVSGRLTLERRTQNGRVRTDVPRGSAIGDDLTFEALPVGAAYIATETAEVIGLNHDIYGLYLAADCEQQEIFRRIHFFTQQLVVPVLEPWYAANGALVAEAPNTDLKASDGGDREDPSGTANSPSATTTATTAMSQYSQTAELLRRLSQDQQAKLKSLAVSVYPICLGSKEIAVREGQLSDDVYFIQSGRMKVVRQVNFTVHSSSPSVKLLDLATLEPGEYFGELGILRHDVDITQTIGVEELLQVTEAEIDQDDPERELLVIDGNTPSRRRQATVYSHTPSTCLVLPRAAFIDIIQQGPLVRMREYAKGYPSSQTIQQHFLKKQEWDAFKSSIFEKHQPHAVTATGGGSGHKGGGDAGGDGS